MHQVDRTTDDDDAVGSVEALEKVTAAAFQLSTTGSTSDGPVEGSAGFYMLRLIERKAPSADGFETEKDGIRDRLLRQKQRTGIQDWIDARKTESQITIEKAYLE